jgi:hypothetical protein
LPRGFAHSPQATHEELMGAIRKRVTMGLMDLDPLDATQDDVSAASNGSASKGDEYAPLGPNPLVVKAALLEQRSSWGLLASWDPVLAVLTVQQTLVLVAVPKAALASATKRAHAKHGPNAVPAVAAVLAETLALLDPVEPPLPFGATKVSQHVGLEASPSSAGGYDALTISVSWALCTFPSPCFFYLSHSGYEWSLIGSTRIQWHD